MERIKRVRETLANLNLDAIIITRDSNRRYLTDFTGSNGIVIISQYDAKVITDYRYKEMAQLQSKNFDIVLHSGHTGHKGSKSTIYKEVIREINAMGAKRVGFEQDHMFFGLYDLLRKNSHFELVPTIDVVEDIRMIKTDKEIRLLKEAAKAADQTFIYILDYIREGMTEKQIAEEMERFTKKQGFELDHLSIQSGYRAAQAHGKPTDKVIEKGDMLVMDFGVNNNGYRSDMCRTVAIGELSNEFKQIYSIVQEALELCLSSLKPGISDYEADKIIKDHIYNNGYGGFEGTGTGHGIGIEAHEIPYLSVKQDKVLQKNMVLTIEPGIYIPGKGGVRIEDMVLITEEGIENWTTSSKELIILDNYSYN